MSKFKVGDKVVRYAVDAGKVMEGKPYLVVSDVQKSYIALEGLLNGCAWYEEYFELYQEPAQKTFNPKPGDLIVTNSGKTFKCMSHEEYCNFGEWPADFAKEFTIFGWRTDSISPRYFCHMRWLGEDGKVEAGAEFDIKEIIPASTNNPVAIPQPPQDLSFQVKALELENQMLRMLLRKEGVDV